MHCFPGPVQSREGITTAYYTSQQYVRILSRAFSVAGPTVWNSLADDLSDPAVDSEHLRRDLKYTILYGHSKEVTNINYVFGPLTSLSHQKHYVITLYKSTFT